MNKVFDFYGVYTRISEPQKFRFVENKVILYYKDLLNEALFSNAVLQNQIDSLNLYNRAGKEREAEILSKVEK